MQEKVWFENGKGDRLCGVFHNSESATNKVIVMVHGFTSNKDRNRTVVTSEVLAKAGFTVFRFDCGGSGESADAPITVENMTNDLKSAINFVKTKDFKEIGLLGESVGGLTSVLVCGDEIKAMVLWSPVTNVSTPGIFGERENLKELKRKGFIIEEKDNRSFKILKQYLEERESISQKEILSGIKCPVLILHGDKDEAVPLEDSKNAMDYLPEGSKLEIINGAGHKFEREVDKASKLTLDWFQRYLV